MSDAERRVMELVYNGINNEKIADKLFLSPNTVKQHIKSVYAKLDIHSRGDFVKYAKENDLFQ